MTTMRLSGFNANDHEAPNFDAIPPGWYTAIITESESKPTKAGNGTYLQLTLEILEGECKGRKIWDRLNLDNSNRQAVEIAHATLAAICKSIDVMTPEDSSELHNQPLQIKITTRDYNGDTQNEVKGYRPANSHNGTGGPIRPNAPQGNRWQPNRSDDRDDDRDHNQGGGGFRSRENYRDATPR